MLAVKHGDNSDQFLEPPEPPQELLLQTQINMHNYYFIPYHDKKTNPIIWCLRFLLLLLWTPCIPLVPYGSIITSIQVKWQPCGSYTWGLRLLYFKLLHSH